MNIKRTLETTKATYDLTGLTHAEFSDLVRAYHYYSDYRRRARPEKGTDPLYDKLTEMAESNIFIV